MSDPPESLPGGPAAGPPIREEHFRALFDQAMIGILEADLDGRILLVNDRYCEILGYAREELLGAHVQDHIHREDLPEVVRLFERLLDEGEPFVVEKRDRRKDGSLVWLQATVSVVRDPAGTPRCIACLVADITERRQVEAALRESEARFRNMADNAPVMVWVTDAEGACTYLSRTWYAFTGQLPDTGLGSGWIEAVHPEDRPGADAAFAQASARCAPFQLDYRLRRRDGVYRWALDAAVPRFGGAGEFLGYIGSVIDITDRKEAETTRQLLVSELNHRVKNMLAIVQGMAYQTARRSPDLRQFLATFDGRLQALSRAHALLTEHVWRGAALLDLVHDQCLIGDDPRVAVAGPPVLLEAQQAVHMALVLHEMCTNARKYGALSVPSGTVALDWQVEGGRLKLHWQESGGPKVPANPVPGFGTKLIVQTIRTHRGEARMSTDEGGVRWTIEFELRPPADGIGEAHPAGPRGLTTGPAAD